MEINISTPDQSVGKKFEVSDKIFGHEFNEALVHQVVTAYMAGARAGTKAQKTRAEVSGGGIKPWRQKGTGRARAGTIRGPLWRHGGRAFAAKPRSYDQKVNRKMYQGAMRSILSELLRQERLLIVDDFALAQPKTRDLIKKLKDFKLEKALIISESIDRNLLLAARNLYNIQLCSPEHLSPVNLIAFEQVLMTVNAMKQVEETLQ